MNIEALATMPMPQALDVKIKKRNDVEEATAVEGSGQGGKSELDLNKDNINRQKPQSLSDRDLELKQQYNSKGSLVSGNKIAFVKNGGHYPIDFLI